MPDVFIRNLDDRVLARLKERARLHDRSLQAELHIILERAAVADIAAFRSLTARIRRALTGRKHSDSASLLATDRRR